MADSLHPSIQDPAIAAILKQPFPEQVAFFRGKLGNLIPTERWTDVWKSGHDRGFMVAGANKADLLSDFAVAVDRTISEGKSLDAFRKDFDAIVDRHGWNYRGGRDWRSRVIYTTNAATSYAAGRVAQLRAAGFGLWVYRHSDSVQHPRPLHLAWNGLTLPPDHPFWSEHGPPNGWGCKCYVLGARDARGARRLGGDPQKPVDPAWEKVDPKTGEKVGIDRGWGYMPGETVVDTVQAMAEKTRQWQYELAKAYMQEAPASVRDDLARAYRALPSVADDMRRYAARILEGRTELDVPPYRTLGLLTSNDVARMQEMMGVNMGGYDYAVDRYVPLHIRKEHGTDLTEVPRGQRPVTADDYARLPAIVDAPDRVWAEGEEALMEKTIGADRYIAIFGPLTKRRMLALKSMRIVGRAPPRSTS